MHCHDIIEINANVTCCFYYVCTQALQYGCDIDIEWVLATHGSSSDSKSRFAVVPHQEQQLLHNSCLSGGFRKGDLLIGNPESEQP